MTATSVLTPTVVTRSWTTVQRIAAIVVLLVAFSLVAFSVGRATAHAHISTILAPSSLTSSGSPTRCPINRPC